MERKEITFLSCTEEKIGNLIFRTGNKCIARYLEFFLYRKLLEINIGGAFRLTEVTEVVIVVTTTGVY